MNSVYILGNKDYEILINLAEIKHLVRTKSRDSNIIALSLGLFLPIIVCKDPSATRWTILFHFTKHTGSSHLTASLVISLGPSDWFMDNEWTWCLLLPVLATKMSPQSCTYSLKGKPKGFFFPICKEKSISSLCVFLFYESPLLFT